MQYPYRCHKCLGNFLIEKKMKYHARQEKCKDCCIVLTRVYTPPMINMGNMEAEYNPAFGKVIHNKKELKDECARHEGETGEKLYEVGNDKMKSIKVKRKEYTTDDIYVGDY